MLTKWLRYYSPFHAMAAASAAVFTLGLTFSEVQAKVDCPIKIGNIRAESGSGAPYGQSLARGLQMGIDEVNASGGIAGCKVELVSYDSQSLPANAATLTQRLMFQDRVSLIFGSSLSLEALATMEMTENAGFPLYVPSAASAKITSQGGKWIWRQSVIDLNAAKVLAGYLTKDLGWKKIGIIYENTDYGKIPVNDVLIPALKAGGATITVTEAVNTGDVDMSSQLLRVRDSGADGVVFWGHDKEGALLLKQYRQLGVTLPVAGNTGLVYPAFLDLLSADTQNNVKFIAISQFVWTSDEPRLKAWIEKYTKLFGKVPDTTSLDGYDAIFVVKKAIEAANSLEPAALQKAFNSVKHDAVGGAISFDKTGQAQRPLVIVKLTPKGGPGFEVIRTISPDAM